MRPTLPLPPPARAGLYAHQAAAEASLQLLHAWKDYKSKDVDGAMIIARAEFVDTIGKCLAKFPNSSVIAAHALPILARVAAIHDSSRAAGRTLIPVIVASLRCNQEQQDAQMASAYLNTLPKPHARPSRPQSSSGNRHRPRSPPVPQGGYSLLIELCRDKEIAQDRAVESGIFPVLVSVLKTPAGTVQQRCTLFRLIAWLCRQEIHARTAFDAGIVPPLVADLKRKVTEVAVLEAACYAVERLAKDSACRVRSAVSLSLSRCRLPRPPARHVQTALSPLAPLMPRRVVSPFLSPTPVPRADGGGAGRGGGVHRRRYELRRARRRDANPGLRRPGARAHWHSRSHGAPRKEADSRC